MSGPFGSSQWMYNPSAGFYGTEIDNSLRFNDNDSPKLSRTFGTATNRKKWTLSMWVKRGNISSAAQFGLFGSYTSGSQTYNIQIQPDGRFQLEEWESANKILLRSDALLRDVSAWYHLMLAVDTTQATSSDRVKMYINGVQQTSFDSSIYPAQNYDTGINRAANHDVGYVNGAYYWDGYIAEMNFVDGQQLDATSFGETKSGVWIPKEYSGSYGTNGFHLEFAGNANDTSGNGNNFTSYNISSYDYVPDSPTNNFATINLLDMWSNYSVELQEGSLRHTVSTINDQGFSSIAIPEGEKIYAEHRINTVGTGRSGLKLSDDDAKWNGIDYLWYDGSIRVNDSNVQTGLASCTVGDIVGFAVDNSAGTIQFYKNGSTVGSAVSFTTSPNWLFKSGRNGSAGAADVVTWNFGQDSTFAGGTTAGGNADDNGYGDFKYAPPSGFLAMCSANLPDPAIDPAADDTPADYFNTVLYTGDGTSGQAITGVGHSPDFVWIKKRSATGSHQLFDTIRGATYRLNSNSTNAEASFANVLQSFDSDGFTVGGDGDTGGSSQTYVAWNWKAGGTGVSNTDGSITSTVSANTDSGFSIVTYTGNATAGATVGHGLLSAPEMIILKNRDRSSDFQVYHKDVTPDAPPTHVVWLNLSNARTDQSRFNDTTPTSSVFYIGPNTAENENGEDFVAYCFHSVDGYSKVGKYTGNGSADGAFIYTGFRPAFVMVKPSSTTGPWLMLDNIRDEYNRSDQLLRANTSDAETGSGELDFLSNGFKYRGTSTNSNYYHNVSGVTYIYLAFAEQPFKYANAR